MRTVSARNSASELRGARQSRRFVLLSLTRPVSSLMNRTQAPRAFPSTPSIAA